MENVNAYEKFKIISVAIIGLFASKLGILAIPMLVLVMINITDYITGLVAAKYRGEKINSYKGFRGIAKKVCMWILVGIGATVDWLILYSASVVGIEFSFKFLVASLVAVWLIANDIISILENMVDIGVDMPPFLQKLVVNIRDKIEKEGDSQ